MRKIFVLSLVACGFGHSDTQIALVHVADGGEACAITCRRLFEVDPIECGRSRDTLELRCELRPSDQLPIAEEGDCRARCGPRYLSACGVVHLANGASAIDCRRSIPDD